MVGFEKFHECYSRFILSLLGGSDYGCGWDGARENTLEFGKNIIERIIKSLNEKPEVVLK